jgi:hypothetical protein
MGERTAGVGDGQQLDGPGMTNTRLWRSITDAVPLVDGDSIISTALPTTPVSSMPSTSSRVGTLTPQAAISTPLSLVLRHLRPPHDPAGRAGLFIVGSLLWGCRRAEPAHGFRVIQGFGAAIQALAFAGRDISRRGGGRYIYFSWRSSGGTVRTADRGSSRTVVVAVDLHQRPARPDAAVVSWFASTCHSCTGPHRSTPPARCSAVTIGSGHGP